MPGYESSFGPGSSSAYFPAASQYYFGDMIGPDFGQLVSGVKSDDVFTQLARAGIPIYRGSPGFYGPGNEPAQAAKGGALADVGATGSRAGMERRTKGAQDWLGLVSDFSAGVAGRERNKLQSNMMRDQGISDIVSTTIGSVLDPGALFNQLLFGGRMGMPNLQSWLGNQLGTLGGLNPSGGGLWNWLTSAPASALDPATGSFSSLGTEMEDVYGSLISSGLLQ